MNWDDVKKDIAHTISRELELSSRDIFHKWTIGDGNEYLTKYHAKIAAQINKKGFIYLDTILNNRKLAQNIDEMVRKGYIEPVEVEQENIVGFKVISRA